MLVASADTAGSAPGNAGRPGLAPVLGHRLRAGVCARWATVSQPWLHPVHSAGGSVPLEPIRPPILMDNNLVWASRGEAIYLAAALGQPRVGTLALLLTT